MAEDTGILFISGRIRGNLTKLDMVSGVSRLEDHDTILGIQLFLYRVQSLFCKTFLNTDTCQNTEALGLNIDLTLFAFLGTNLVAVSIIGTDEPFTVPAIL